MKAVFNFLSRGQRIAWNDQEDEGIVEDTGFMSLEKVLSGLQILFSVRMRCENTQPFPSSFLFKTSFWRETIIRFRFADLFSTQIRILEFLTMREYLAGSYKFENCCCWGSFYFIQSDF